jgi:glycopeptide antibiotics resistance protein
MENITGFKLPAYNYIPFKSITSILKAPSLGLIIKQIFGNVLLLLPLPIFIATLNRRVKYKTLFICGFLVSVSIELGQFILDGFFTEISIRCTDIDDVILNSLGVLIGILVYKFTKQYILKLEQIINFQYDNAAIKEGNNSC